MRGLRPVSRQVSIRRIFQPPVLPPPQILQANIIVGFAVVVDLTGFEYLVVWSVDGERLGLVQSVWIRLYVPLRTIPRRSGS
jgi:hypothetical protein